MRADSWSSGFVGSVGCYGKAWRPVRAAARDSRVRRHSPLSSSGAAGGLGRQLGEDPWASARMRCFIVGGTERRKDHACWSGAVLRGVRGCATGVVSAAGVMSPSVVQSDRNAVTIAFHSFITWSRAMIPHFRSREICVLCP